MAQHLEKKIFDLKLAAKQIQRSAKKLKKQETKEIQTSLKHVMRGELEIGRIHAENAVRNYNQSLDLLTLEARLQGALNILQAATVQNSVTSAMRSVVSSMVTACGPRDMNLTSVSATMDRFERMTDHLGARQTYTTELLGGAMAATAGTDQVDLLMARIVDRAGLDVKGVMPAAFAASAAAVADISSPQQTTASLSSPADPIAGLDEKLTKLRNDYG